MDTAPATALGRTYIVRLYRVAAAEGGAMAGLVEDIEGGSTRSFRSSAELLQLLRAGVAEVAPTERG